jgi:ferritin-like metal-binding protein YciE
MSFLKTDKLEDVFHTELCDILNAEKQLTKALPKMADNASDPELAAGFRNHLTETEGQISRLERIHEILDMKVKAETCDAMKGLIHEADELIGGTAKGPVRDAAMIAAAQKVEHYEIATYGTLIALSKTLGYSNEVVSLFEQTLSEEKAADEKLSSLAEGHINQDAMRQAA